MISNFLGDVGGYSAPASCVISTNELMTREGVEMKMGMNFRDERDRLSVFLVLPKQNGFNDVWDKKKGTYTYVGHDSTTVESGKSVDQLMMYGGGKLTENGKFLKAANAFKDGVRKEPLQVQVYEKLEQGAWYDKGIFNLLDAKQVPEGSRKVFHFYLAPADAEFYADDDPDQIERMLPASVKAETWKACKGRCRECDTERGLHFVKVSGKGMQLRCEKHGGKLSAGLLG